jgi:hypothetical protein
MPDAGQCTLRHSIAVLQDKCASGVLRPQTQRVCYGLNRSPKFMRWKLDLQCNSIGGLPWLAFALPCRRQGRVLFGIVNLHPVLG